MPGRDEVPCANSERLEVTPLFNVFRIRLALLALAAAVGSGVAVAKGDARVAPVAAPPALHALDAHVPGRVLRAADGLSYQWPGVYFETSFSGPKVYFKLGRGDVILRVQIDGHPVATLTKPTPGVYQITNLVPAAHQVRIEALTESQAGPNVFGGFFRAAGTLPRPIQVRSRQIEFIGDSHTVGYGNTSTTRDCTQDQVWATTDNTAAFGPQIARHYGADYQVNAISGRGIVRNYDGFAADPLPVVYPFTLFDRGARVDGTAWTPQVIVIALGTNDFSTPLHAGEKWPTRDALHADYESTYLKFLESLRARNPDARIVIWATDMAEGEIAREANKVVEARQAAGDARIDFVAVNGLAMTGCHWHPSVADDVAIAAKLIPVIDAGAPWPGS